MGYSSEFFRTGGLELAMVVMAVAVLLLLFGGGGGLGDGG